MGKKMLLAMALALTGGCAAQVAPPVAQSAVVAADTVFVLRHLQKGEGSDPSLTAEGAAGAQRLADRLAGSGIVAIFATPTRRAQETAAPLAQRLGIAVTPYDPRDPAALVAAARAASGPVLIVGHSNTVPDIVGRFGALAPAPLSEADYGTLFIVDQSDRLVETVAV